MCDTGPQIKLDPSGGTLGSEYKSVGGRFSVTGTDLVREVITTFRTRCYQRNSTKHQSDELGISQCSAMTLGEPFIAKSDEVFSEELVEATNRVVIFTVLAVCPDQHLQKAKR